MKPQGLTPENSVFVFLSFEGPDLYSLAGGLGVRIDHVTRTLADIGYTTHLFFIGDPGKPGEEKIGNLVLHRWCQWLSKYYPKGVYDGEEPKLNDFTDSIPGFVIEHIVSPAIAEGKIVAIMGEEWQTAETMCRISDALYEKGLRDKTIMFWNANNTYSFERVNWARLNYVTTITTVSRYMRHVMGRMGLNPLVIPNGIPREMLKIADEYLVKRLKKTLDVSTLLCKVARWHPDKRWIEAVEAAAILKKNGVRSLLLAVGGAEGYGSYVEEHASSIGLVIKNAVKHEDSAEGYISSLTNALPADIITVKFHLPLDFLAVMYHAADATLANSGHEPFGIVGLEAMAAGGVVFTGGTGEDYAIPFVNSIGIETANPAEIVGYLMYLSAHQGEASRLRRVARITARYFTWDNAVRILLNKLNNRGAVQGILDMFALPALKLTPSSLIEEISGHSLNERLDELLTARFKSRVS